MISASPQKPQGSANPELDWIDHHFSGENAPRRFDGFGRSNDHSNDYYDTRLHPESARTRACVSVEWVAFAETTQDRAMIYVPCGISSGLRPHELLDQKNKSNANRADYEAAVSTYKADEHLGYAHKDKAIEPNRGDNLRRGRMVGRMHPDSIIIAPVGREGSVREVTRTGAFSRWQKYEEEDFMAFWYPVIDRSRGMMLDGDWNYSRNSIWEMMRGVLAQTGQIPSRPRADMEVFDLEGNPVSLQARAEKLAETLKYQLGKGFEAREAATALAQIFAIHDDILAGTIPMEGASLHPRLQNRPAAELRAMETLKTELKPILLQHCAHYMRLDDLPQEYRLAAKTAPGKAAQKKIREQFAAFADDISTRALDILSVKPSPQLRQTLAATNPQPQRMFDSHEQFFEHRSKAKLFEDDLYSKLAEWERLALPFAIGGMETGLYPANHPMATALFTDLKRGTEGFAKAQQAGITDMNEFAGGVGRDVHEVIATNKEAAEALKAALKLQTPGKIVLNTPSFLRIADTIEHFRKGEEKHRFIAAAGASETSPLARLALQMKYLDRNVDKAVFQDGWQHSNDLVQLRVRARLIQAGLVERPAGAQAAMRVMDAADPGMPVTLLEDIVLLTQEVKRACDAQIRAPEQALALARLVTLHELLVDPSLQNSGGVLQRELINPLTADESLTCYNREEAKQVTKQAKALLLGQAAQWIPRERLYAERNLADDADHAAAKQVQNRRMEDYIKAGESLRKQQDWQTRASRNDEVRIDGRGARQ